MKKFILMLLCLSCSAFATSNPPGDWTAYVADIFSGQVTPINLLTNTPLAPIPMQQNPVSVAITPDGTTAYVANQGSNVIIPIDVATNTAEAAIPSLGGAPNAVAITPDGKTVYVACGNSALVMTIDVATNTPGVAIPVGSAPIGLAITPDGSTVYVANALSNSITPIATATNTPGAPIPVGNEPFAVAITPDGATLYVANAQDNNVTPISTATNIPGPTIAVGNFPDGIAITPDGQTAFVINASSNNITPISIATNTPGPSFFIGSTPVGIAIAPDGKTGYVTLLNSGTLAPFIVATHFIGTPIAAGGGPDGIAITPDQAPTAAFTVSSTPDGLTIIFDASASSSPVGSIANYSWDFGDGHTASTSNPLITHTYASPGSYLVTLTVTNSAGTSTTQTFTGQTVSNNGGPSAVLSMELSLPLLLPPSLLSGKQVANRFLTQTELVNVLFWSPPLTGEPPVAYKIYRDPLLHKLLATVSASGTLKYLDHNRKEGKAYTYFIVSVDATGRQSASVSIVIVPKF